MGSTCQVESICVITLQIIIIISQKSHDNIIIVDNHPALSPIQLKIRANKLTYINIYLVEIVNNVTEIFNKLLRIVNKLVETLNKLPRIVNKLVETLNKLPRIVNKLVEILNKLLRIINKLA